MRITSSDLLVNSEVVFDSACIFVGAKLVIKQEDDFLVLYDSNTGSGGKVIAYLDKDTPDIMFEGGYHCIKGLYASLPRDGEYIVYTG